MRNPFLNKSLRTQLLFWFLFIALLPLSWTTFITYQLAKESLLTQSANHLKAISLRQAQLIENYFKEKERNTASLVKDERLARAVDQFEQALKGEKSSLSYAELEKKYRSSIAFQAETLGYSNLFLITSKGEVVFSIRPSFIHVGMNLLSPQSIAPQLRETLDSVTSFLETQVSPLLFIQPTNPASFIAAPLLEDQRLAGIVLAQINNTSVYQLIENYNGLGLSGETLVVAQDKDHLVSITPLRHEDDKTVVHEINPASSFGLFVKKVLDGNRIAVVESDYRGVEALMVGRHFLPPLNWGVITKMDMNELLSPIQKLKTLFWLLALSTTLLVILLAVQVAKKITHPLLLLTEKTRLMASGKLKQKIEIDASSSELQKLEYSFNEMAEQLDTVVGNLDHLVEKRTHDYEIQNIKLEETIQELRETQKRLVIQEKLASLGALTAGIAHEIKNPLNFITNFAVLSLDLQKSIDEQFFIHVPIEEKSNYDEQMKLLNLNIEKIHEYGLRADSILRNMLLHSRGTPGKREMVDINALLNEYINLSYHGMRAKNPNFNVGFEKKFDESLPAFLAVPQELGRVFLNLLNNAYYALQIKSETTPSFKPYIKIITEKQKKNILISCCDNGTGISPEVEAKLFTPFFTTKPPGAGTGLGLSLSYDIIVHEYNGTLSVRSEEGLFAEFTITLPIKNPTS
ncbi:MAG: ATP-binding protein [Parachlamydia sp.]|jgi:signal transduction histidine kinase|nr:ATP-binding protein [Parachlamydia sp.]